MAKAKTADKFEHEDGGRDWLAKFQEALLDGERVELPDFESSKPEHVRQPVYGAFLVDPTTNVVHRVAGSSRECGLDSIASPGFVHFWVEVQRAHPKATLCETCSWETSPATEDSTAGPRRTRIARTP